MAFLLSPTANKLCDNCLQLLRLFDSEPQSLWEDDQQRKIFRGDHHSHAESFSAAVQSGCRICQILRECNTRVNGTIVADFETSATLSVAGSIILTITQERHPWQPNSQYTQLRLVIVEEGSQIYNRLIETCHSTPLSLSMDDPSVIKLARRWMQTCCDKSHGHERCNVVVDSTFHPPRLIDVGADTIHLSLASQRSQHEPYCTLSYCWGGTNQFRLTASNISSLLNRIELSALPRTIQDAIKITKSLGIRYIWIDSLCIVQEGDGGADWNFHASEMSRIYSNCIVNLSADRASSADEGFLGARTGSALRPVFIDGPSLVPPLREGYAITFSNVTDVALASEPLGSRAWVLSERTLSPRIIHFASGEVFWECASYEVASESCPNGFQTSLGNWIYGNFTFSDRQSNYAMDWTQVLTSYTMLSLTLPQTDKLVAIAGIGKFFEEQTQKTLVAGLLKDTLPLSLMWRRDTTWGIQPSRSETYRAPSWSWASMDGALYFWHSCDLFQFYKHVAQVEDVWVKPFAGQSHLGQLQAGAITLTGPVISLGEVEGLISPQNRNRRLTLHWDEDRGTEAMETTSMLMVSIWCFKSNSIRGLLIAQHPESNTWSRRGAVDINFEEMFEEPHISEPCQAFVDRGQIQTVTLV